MPSAAANMRRELPRLLKLLILAAVADAKTNFDKSADPDGKPWAPLAFARVRGGSLPLRDTGALMASIIGKGTGHIERFTTDAVEVGTNHIGANLHQHGGVVVPKNAKALAIPLTREAARAVSPRSFARDLFVMWTRGAPSGVLAERRGKGNSARVVAHFALVRRVVVPARPFIGAGVRLLTKLELIAANWLEETVTGGTRHSA